MCGWYLLRMPNIFISHQQRSSMECELCDFNSPRIIKEYKYWKLSAAAQTPLGWTHAMLKRHVSFFDELTEEELAELKQVIKDVRGALDKLWKPDWFNVTQLGNSNPHLHVNLIPRYKEKREFAGKTFEDKTFGSGVESEELSEDIVEKVRERLRD